MNPSASPNSRCGLDVVELARMERMLAELEPGELRRLFTERELEQAGDGPGRVASLAARFAAKEACCKLFPRETALGGIGVADFEVEQTGSAAPKVAVSAIAQAVLDRHFIAGIGVSLTHTKTAACAIAWADRKQTRVPWSGKAIYHLFPWRRSIVLGNLKRVFGDVLAESEIRLLAQAYYAHLVQFPVEFIRLPLMSVKQRKAWVTVENMETAVRAHNQGKGILLLTGHFGNWEAATVAGIGQFPEYFNLFHFLRRPLKPRWFNEFVTRRFRRSGFGSLASLGSLDAILKLLSAGQIIVFVFDQHAGGRDGIPVEFFGHPAGTFKSLAILALTTGAPVIPACSWREPDGRHVIRFEDPLPLIECADVSEAIRQNTRAYNQALERMLLRHPEQWIWMHRRWKLRSPQPPT